MKALLLLVIIAVTAPSISSDSRVSGVDGWYVPRVDGSYYWVDINHKPSLLETLEDDLESLFGGDKNPVKFYLLTKKNPTEFQQIDLTVASIKDSYFDSSIPTKFSIHGWRMTYESSMNTDVALAWFQHADYNIIVPDWSRALDDDYASSVSAVPGVGKKVAQLIDLLQTSFNLDINNLELIGHSLGAHVCGFAGKNVKSGKIKTIVALDAALPLYHMNQPTQRLCNTDAQYVQAIHTCGGKLGFLTAIGSSDFYPNGGVNQPGCGMDFLGMCDHARSVLYYVEAVNLDNFASTACSTYEDAVNNSCGTKISAARMGAVLTKYKVLGTYYVPVNSQYPFGTLTA